MSKWISVKDRLPEDIIDLGPTADDPNVVQYKISPDGINEYLVTDGENCAVGYWRPDAKAWDSFNFGWIERRPRDKWELDTQFGIGVVTHWMPLPELPNIQ